MSCKILVELPKHTGVKNVQYSNPKLCAHVPVYAQNGNFNGVSRCYISREMSKDIYLKGRHNFVIVHIVVLNKLCICVLLSFNHNTLKLKADLKLNVLCTMSVDYKSLPRVQIF